MLRLLIYRLPAKGGITSPSMSRFIDVKYLRRLPI
jgi:hypothetical protein